MLWKALQYIGESSLYIAIARYVTGYVTKAEQSNMQEEVSSHASINSKLWSFGIHSLRFRECGLYEASAFYSMITCVISHRLSSGSTCLCHITENAGRETTKLRGRP